MTASPRRPGVAVFCGSRPGRPVDRRLATDLGSALARSGRRVVYGGGHVGLMGLVADAAMGAGGEVVGVIPQHLHDREVAHHGLTSLEVVPDMHTRKKRMADLADAFVALPGGVGTLEELFEMVTWRQLGLHDKPVAVLDEDGFYAPLLDQLARMTDDGYLDAATRDGVARHTGVPDVLAWLDRP
ncbi:MAG: TIGR00730 family Rossman fold protein [Nocardioides sp.]|nr:TIGR00730 family Rossman fold protein [Nocardioides sp.]